MAKRKPIKVGVKTGTPPGYEWNVGILDVAFEQAMDLLKDYQYDHMAEQVRDLASHNDPTHSDTLSLDVIEDFHELRDWGGVLGGLNVRVFYGVHKPTRSLLVLGIITKQNNGPTPLPNRVLMRNRWHKFNRGDYGPMPI